MLKVMVKVITFDIAPRIEVTSLQKFSGMARVLSRDFTVLSANSRIYPRTTLTIPAFVFYTNVILVILQYGQQYNSVNMCVRPSGRQLWRAAG